MDPNVKLIHPNDAMFSKLKPKKPLGEEPSICPNCFGIWAYFMTCSCFCCCCNCPSHPFFRTLNEGDALVISYFGKAYCEIQKAGSYLINPCGLNAQIISIKEESIDLVSIKATDKRGVSIITSAVIRFRIVNATLAALEVSDYHAYILNQATCALRQVCAIYPYLSPDVNELSLHNSKTKIEEELVARLVNPLKNCGALVISMKINEITYAPEVIANMLVSQQAQSKLDAAEEIVSGSIDIALKTINGLSNTSCKIGDKDRNVLIKDLLTVICSEESPKPLITTL